MERTESENHRRRRRMVVARNKEGVQLRRTLSLPPVVALRAPAPVINEVKLAAIAVDLNVRLRLADMPVSMQERVLRYTRFILCEANSDNNQKKLNPTHIAMYLKKEFDRVYGPAWHCIVGKSFGSYVTHSSGGFIYFSADKLSFLLFKTEVRPVAEFANISKQREVDDVATYAWNSYHL
ncbi:hypothetical protein ACFE04_028431 [Oxalis oulophora]